jgi:hypothetical protein
MSATQAIRGIAVAAVVVLAVLAAPASATFPGSNGQITFFRDDATDGSVEIWRAEANGDNQVKRGIYLTPTTGPVTEADATKVVGIPGNGVGVSEPQFSPDDHEIIHGSPSTQTSASFYNNRVFSPDGTSLAFTHFLFFDVQLERSTATGANVTPTVVSPDDFQNRTDWGSAPAV